MALVPRRRSPSALRNVCAASLAPAFRTREGLVEPRFGGQRLDPSTFSIEIGNERTRVPVA
jgi:hypothetical protein